jgi:hypothetical protein
VITGVVQFRPDQLASRAVPSPGNGEPISADGEARDHPHPVRRYDAVIARDEVGRRRRAPFVLMNASRHARGACSDE